MPCHFCPLGAQSEEERTRVPRVHSQVHGGVEQRLVCESQPPDQPWWESVAATTASIHNRLLTTIGKSCPVIIVLELAKHFSLLNTYSILKVPLFNPSGIWKRDMYELCSSFTFPNGGPIVPTFFISLPYQFKGPPLWHTIFSCVYMSVSEFSILFYWFVYSCTSTSVLTVFYHYTFMWILELAYQISQKCKFLSKVLE